MQDEIDNINIGASVETVSPVTTVSDNNNTTQLNISNPATFINSNFDNNYVRVYHCADISTPQRVFQFVKRLKFSDLATDTDIPNVSGTFERNMIIFENSALPGIIANNATAFGFEAERTTRESANINVFYQTKIPVLGDNLTPDNFEMEPPSYNVFNFPTTIGTGYEQLSGDFHNVITPCFLCVLLDNTKNNFRFTSTLSNITIPVNTSYNYDVIGNKIVRDPLVNALIPNIMSLNDDINNYVISTPLQDNSGVVRWLCPSLTVRNSLTNLPSDFPGYPDFEVEFRQLKSGGVGIQTITGGSLSSIYVAKRIYKNNSFSSWYKETLTPLT